MSEDFPEPRSWPTHAEVREIVKAILEMIERTPEWKPKEGK